jgi:3-oxoadipate enol-lactonase
MNDKWQESGAALHFRSLGDGHPLLYIHGFPLSSEMWLESAQRIPPGYRQLIPDLPGHGRSPVPPESSMAAYAVALRALLDDQRIEAPVVLVGMSMGGYIAFEMIRQDPNRVRALVLANTRASADTSEQKEARREKAARVRGDGVEFLADEMAATLFSPGTSDALRQKWRKIMAQTPPAGVSAALLAMADRPDSMETLRGFPGPTLVVAGADDQLIPRADAIAMATVAAHGRFELLQDAGHMAPVEQPERFGELLSSFLASLPTVRLEA